MATENKIKEFVNSLDWLQLLYSNLEQFQQYELTLILIEFMTGAF